ncbi:hypothetical protein FQB35_02690 [Crassaminicella thermophila]|uniref:Uncharacterized protein n=1 Tax=Crassaminicella thermophila TaxID=2599308 RepID=A0A5C0SDN4_CRATE|nr:hypothetical protein [Crassaminicella thermophila]QEK11364.1 hypothetical protein FQB35_02690 [Crassaminicella thermophila]
MVERKYLNQMYSQNPDTGNFIVEIQMENYLYIFNEWDSASFKRRDIDPDLSDFLESCSSDIPLNMGIELHFNILNEERSLKKEKTIISGLRNYYARCLYFEKQALKELYRKFLFYILIAFPLFFCSYALDYYIVDNIIFTGLLEGVYVGGWVFLWAAIEMLAFDRGPIIRKIKECNRLLKAPIYFSYDDLSK